MSTTILFIDAGNCKAPPDLGTFATNVAALSRTLDFASAKVLRARDTRVTTASMWIDTLYSLKTYPLPRGFEL